MKLLELKNAICESVEEELYKKQMTKALNYLLDDDVFGYNIHHRASSYAYKYWVDQTAKYYIVNANVPTNERYNMDQLAFKAETDELHVESVTLDINPVDKSCDATFLVTGTFKVSYKDSDVLPRSLPYPASTTVKFKTPKHDAKDYHLTSVDIAWLMVVRLSRATLLNIELLSMRAWSSMFKPGLRQIEMEVERGKWEKINAVM